MTLLQYYKLAIDSVDNIPTMNLPEAKSGSFGLKVGHSHKFDQNS